MMAKIDKHEQKNRNLLFGGAALIIFMIGLGNYCFDNQSMLLRVIFLLAAIVCAVFLMSKTAFGKKAWTFWQESLVEVRKVVWPTKKETIQSTMGVLAMVVIMGLILWSIDAILVRIVAWLLQCGV